MSVKSKTTGEPIKIEESIAIDDSCQFMLYARGAHAKQDFIKACKQYLKHNGYPAYSISLKSIKRDHWRIVPLKNNIVCETRFVEDQLPGPGAFAVTLVKRWLPLHVYRKP